jgi:hypothetical protein
MAFLSGVLMHLLSDPIDCCGVEVVWSLGCPEREAVLKLFFRVCRVATLGKRYLRGAGVVACHR